MGKGDKRTKKGKIWRKSYGVSRPRVARHAAVVVVTKEEKAAKLAAIAAKEEAKAEKALKAESKKKAAPKKKAEAKKAEPKKAAAKKVEEKKAPAKKAAPKKKASKDGDQLTKIEGIGPKISGILTEGGIDTFAKLASAKVDKLKELLAEAGGRYKSHDPSTWPEQSALAAADKWDELKVLQDELDGGKKK